MFAQQYVSMFVSTQSMFPTLRVCALADPNLSHASLLILAGNPRVNRRVLRVSLTDPEDWSRDRKANFGMCGKYNGERSGL